MGERPIHPWLLVALLWVIAALNYIDRQMVFSLFPLLRSSLGATDVQLGLLSTVFLLVYGALSPFAGYIADRIGKGRVILAGLLIWSLVTWLTSFATSIGGLLVSRALMGVSEACYLPAALALIMEAHSDRSRSLAAGIHSSGLYTGIVLGGTWGGWAGQHYGWRPAFAVCGLIGIAYFAILFWIFPKSRTNTDASPSFSAAAARLLQTPGFLVLTAGFTAISIANWLVNTWMPSYVYDRFGLSLTEAGFSASFYIQAASYAGVFLGGWMADRWTRSTPRGRILTQIIGLFAAAPFLCLMGFTRSFTWMAVAMITYGLGRGLYDANAMPVLAQIAAKDLRATGYGIFNLAGCVVGGLTTVLAAQLKSAVGLGAAFPFAGVLLFLCAALLRTAPVGVAGHEESR